MQPTSSLFARLLIVLCCLLYLPSLSSPTVAQGHAQAADFSCAAVTEIPQAECAALVDIYTIRDGSGLPQPGGWLATNTPCRWLGISCVRQHITHLDVSGFGLSGNLPTTVGQLTHLQYLRLNGNQLTSLPAEISNLIHLQYLQLKGNQLTSLPVEISNLTQLQYLDLDYNQLTSLPTTIGNLTQLSSLSLIDNQLTSVPAELGKLINLPSLNLENNQLTSVPGELGNLTQLGSLWLDHNQLTHVPPELGKLTNLEDLRLNNNQLVDLPLELGNLNKLNSFNLENNQLTSVPGELGNLTNLWQLWLSHNQLTHVPPELGKLTNLEDLRLNNNQLVDLPLELGNLTNLIAIDLSANQLTRVPSSLGNFTSLTVLQMRDTPTLSGPLPRHLLQLQKLFSFSVEGTNLCAPADAAFQTWLARFSYHRVADSCLTLTPNFATGAPGSQLLLTGSEFPTDTVTLSVNGVVLGTVQPEMNQPFTVTLSTADATPGSYIVVADMGIAASTQFELRVDAPLHPTVGDSTFVLPAGIAYTSTLHLPFVATALTYAVAP